MSEPNDVFSFERLLPKPPVVEEQKLVLANQEMIEDTSDCEIVKHVAPPQVFSTMTVSRAKEVQVEAEERKAFLEDVSLNGPRNQVQQFLQAVLPLP